MAHTNINELLNEGLAAKRRVSELYALIEEEKNNEADLSGLNSTSKTAVWRLWLYVFSAVSWIQEKLWNMFKKEVEEIVASGVAGTARWLAQEARKFQYGDTVQIDPVTTRVSYPAPDAAKQIVKRVAVAENGGLTTLKAAKLDINGDPTALLTDELNSFKAYINSIQFAGANLQIVSQPADLLNLRIRVYYNALRQVEQVKTAVNKAILSHLGNLDFNGQLYKSKFMDAIQACEGVVDVVIDDLQAKPNGGNYNSIDRIYAPLSGYYAIDPAYPLENTSVIEYQPA